jgi:hypothetical protein
MQAITPGHVSLYAVVPTHEALAQRKALRGLRLVACGPVAAVVGKPTQEVPRAALRHDRGVGRALEACASVVPFRLGLVLEPKAELPHVLKVNLPTLSRYLARFRGRVEMSFKVKLAAPPSGEPLRLPFSLERFHALAPEPPDRREQVKRTPTARIFEGSYLVSRQDIEHFWSAVHEIQQACPGLPLVGSGPWAPYSFCDFALRPGR